MEELVTLLRECIQRQLTFRYIPDNDNKGYTLTINGKSFYKVSEALKFVQDEE